VSPGKEGKWLQIGEFARRAGVSVKTARYYASSGLLIPAFIEPGSSYRYYRLDQVVTLRRIRELRALGLSIAELKTWMASAHASFERIDLLETLKGRLQRQMADDARRLQLLQRLIESEFDIERSIAPVAAYTIRDRTQSMHRTVYRMIESAEMQVGRHGARSLQPPFLLLHDGRYGEAGADVEVCVPILKDAAGAIGGKWIEGANRAACGRFMGPYKNGTILFKGMQRWMQSSGMRAAGPVREVYLRYGADQHGYTIPAAQLARATADYLTELQIPITAS